MEFSFTHACINCGTSLVMKESDRLATCTSCKTANLLSGQVALRLALPPARRGDKLFYVPYLHFRGSFYSCIGEQIEHKLFDFSRLGAPLDFLPATLDHEFQKTRLQIAAPAANVFFLKNTLSLPKILAAAGKAIAPDAKSQHQAAFADVVSIIYLPISVFSGRLFHGITGEALVDMPEEGDPFAGLLVPDTDWPLHFTAAACPGCSAPLAGERKSFVLACGKCKSAWLSGEDGLKKLALTSVVSDKENAVYLPFWQIKAYAAGGAIKTYREFAEATNQPADEQAANPGRDMHYWVPAFKTAPGSFLEAAGLFTVRQPDNKAVKGFPPVGAPPVPFPVSEAFKALKLTFAHAARNKHDIFPWLPRLRFQVKNYSLILIPFVPQGENLVHAETGLSIRRADVQ